MSFGQNSVNDDQTQNFEDSYSGQCHLSYDSLNTDGEINSPKKRRKIDKDGFLCPATPDIPITSCQYGDSTYHGDYSDQKDSNLHFSDDYQTPEDTAGIQNNTSEEPINIEDDTAAGGCSNDQYQGETNAASSQFCSESGEIAEKDTNGMTLAEVVEDFGQESKLLHNQWAEPFRESENFENLCPVRLDKMIEQAKQLEQSLLKQKDLLCTRLNVISHIIKASIAEGPGGDN